MPKLLKILHVEDDFDYSDMFQLQMNRIAKKRDCEELLFDIVASVEEALQKIDKNSYDCIVCDYQIFNGNGLDCLKEIRKINALVPIIFLTGQGDEQVAREAFVHGANDYFTKDVGLAGYDRIYNSMLRHIELFETTMRKEEAEKKYQAIFETASTAIIIIEEDRTISLVNSKFEELSGHAKEEVENRMKWTDFVAKDDLERMKKYHRNRRVDGKSAPSEYEFQFITKGGSARDIFLSVGIIPGTKRSVASLLDITERKKMEKTLQKHGKELDLLYGASQQLSQT
ncbi:MAG: PAS domain S-box protein, partial [Candidatus Methanofastidiosia archaeon]